MHIVAIDSTVVIFVLFEDEWVNVYNNIKIKAADLLHLRIFFLEALIFAAERARNVLLQTIDLNTNFLFEIKRISIEFITLVLNLFGFNTVFIVFFFIFKQHTYYFTLKKAVFLQLLINHIYHTFTSLRVFR